MSKTNDEIDKIILKFEENGFSSNSNTNTLFAFNKTFRKKFIDWTYALIFGLKI
jgi:hypothetical protein